MSKGKNKPGKAPEDRKAKNTGPAYEEVEITVGEGDDARTIPARRATVNGVTATVPLEALDDFEVLDDIRAIQDSNDASRLPSLLRRLVGDDYKRILNELRGDNGRVTVEDGAKFVLELFQAIAPGN